ncbi:MAG: hypothetical protein VXW15_15135, partial [Bdellovibrionota bacterium]|nr:hypothetical protein [Bdellovibrionota bacterium]
MTSFHNLSINDHRASNRPNLRNNESVFNFCSSDIFFLKLRVKKTFKEDSVKIIVALRGGEVEQSVRPAVLSALRQLGGEVNAVTWLEGSPEVLLAMVRSYEDPKVALNYGLMLREAIRHERLATILLNEEETFTTLFRCIESPHFDVASDAFATCRDL